MNLEIASSAFGGLAMTPTFLVLFFLIAAIYSSVGHGGASGYLALLSFFALGPRLMSTTALLLNLLVAGIAWIYFAREGYFVRKLLLPFVVSSIPAAFLGGMWRVPAEVYSLLLAGVLIFSAFRLWTLERERGGGSAIALPVNILAFPVGAGVGWLSGVVGVGGGIFLSPILLFFRWADAKQTAALSSAFIFLNSLAGILGRSLQGSLEWGPLLPLAFAAGGGALAGGFLGARRFTNRVLRRILALVLFTASFKLILKAV